MRYNKPGAGDIFNIRDLTVSNREGEKVIHDLLVFKLGSVSPWHGRTYAVDYAGRNAVNDVVNRWVSLCELETPKYDNIPVGEVSKRIRETLLDNVCARLENIRVQEIRATGGNTVVSCPGLVADLVVFGPKSEILDKHLLSDGRFRLSMRSVCFETKRKGATDLLLHEIIAMDVLISPENITWPIDNKLIGVETQTDQSA